MSTVTESPSVRIKLFTPNALLIWVCAAFTLGGCGKASVSEKAEAKEEKPAQTAPAPAAGAARVVEFKADAPELHQISIEALKAIPIPADEVTATAKIEANPNRVARAVLPIPGNVVRVMVKLGDSVQQGQPVAEIVGPAIAEAEAAFVQSEAAVRQADAGLAKADADVARITDLFEHEAVAKKEVLAAQTALAQSKAALDQAHSSRDQARARLELLGLKPGRFQQRVVVKAPISGKVLEIAVAEGETHNEISTPLVTIADLSRVWASSQVPESDIRYCRVGGMAELELIAYPNERFRARVTRIADTVDSETRSIKVNAELDNSSGKLRPEMFGRLKYTDAIVPTAWVPEAAVIQLQGRDAVFVEEAHGKFAATPVQLGRRFGAGFILKSGVNLGQRIVTSGSVYLKAGL